MHRSFALFFALILTTVSIATTGFAADADILRFELSDAGKDRLQLALRRNTPPNRSTGSSFEVRELSGFDRAALNRDGTPVRFALVREPGRIDCSGRSESRRARGNCRFTGDPAFAAFLVGAGIRRPTTSEWIDLTMVGAKRSLVEALRQGRYAMPSPSGLAGLTALNVTPDYIRTMAASGYRPRRTEDFITLKALDVSPAYIASLKRVGYDRVPAEELIQLKALGVTADFIASYQRRGYRNLSVSRLVQLKALGIRPEDIGRSGPRRPVAMTSDGAPAILSALMP